MKINALEVLKNMQKKGHSKNKVTIRNNEKVSGEIRIRMSNCGEYYQEITENGIKVISALCDFYEPESMENTADTYFCVHSDEVSADIENDAYVVTMPFEGAKDFVMFIFGVLNKCGRITYKE